MLIRPLVKSAFIGNSLETFSIRKKHEIAQKTMKIDQAASTHRIMTIQEVSDFLRLPVSTIYMLAKKGKLKGAKFGKQWRFLEQDIIQYIRSAGHGYEV